LVMEKSWKIIAEKGWSTWDVCHTSTHDVVLVQI